MSSSSANNKRCFWLRCSNIHRIRASLRMRCGSESLAASFARFQTQPSSPSQRRIVSAETWMLRLTLSWAERVAQLQRVRHQPKAFGEALSNASKERFNEGDRRVDRTGGEIVPSSAKSKPSELVR